MRKGGRKIRTLNTIPINIKKGNINTIDSPTNGDISSGLSENKPIPNKKKK